MVIDHSGSITQLVRFDEKAWHAGSSSWDGLHGLNQYSVGIEIANWGRLLGSRGNWSSYTGTSLPDSRVIEAAHRHAPNQVKGWEIYDEAQTESAVLAVRCIANEYGIEEKNILDHDDISPDRKSDPGPAWDMNRFRTRVFGRKSDSPLNSHYEVIAASGLNMRMGPSIADDKIKTLKQGAMVTKIETDGLWWLVSEIIKVKKTIQVGYTVDG